MLTRQAWQGRSALGLGAMAAGTSGQTAVFVAMQVDVFAHAGQIGILGWLGLDFLLLEKLAQRHHFVGRQLGHHVGHRRAFALAALEVFKLLGNVFPMLARQSRKHLARRLAFHAMAYKADAAHDLFRARFVGLCQCKGCARTGGQNDHGLGDSMNSVHDHFRIERSKKTPLVLRQRRFFRVQLRPGYRPRCCAPRPGRNALRARWLQKIRRLSLPP